MYDIKNLYNLTYFFIFYSDRTERLPTRGDLERYWREDPHLHLSTTANSLSLTSGNTSVDVNVMFKAKYIR